jgi:hypothetical protein
LLIVQALQVDTVGLEAERRTAVAVERQVIAEFRCKRLTVKVEL